jgi:hypothetical protein
LAGALVEGADVLVAAGAAAGVSMGAGALVAWRANSAVESIAAKITKRFRFIIQM